MPQITNWEYNMQEVYSPNEFEILVFHDFMYFIMFCYENINFILEIFFIAAGFFPIHT